jgi:hypothetical protein
MVFSTEDSVDFFVGADLATGGMEVRRVAFSDMMNKPPRSISTGNGQSPLLVMNHSPVKPQSALISVFTLS